MLTWHEVKQTSKRRRILNFYQNGFQVFEPFNFIAILCS